MNTFRTDVSTGEANQLFGLKNPILTVGSCFADAIGERLKKFKFNVSTNPFGAIYNPISIHKVLSYSIEGSQIPENTFIEQNEINLNYDFHSKFAALTKDDLQMRLHRLTKDVHHFIRSVDCIMITYGTAFVYERNDGNGIVANCHKVPAKLFTKRLLSTEEIVRSYNTLRADLRKINPSCKIILTVSPVRHLKDTLELNSVSKSVLRLACHLITSLDADTEYFPAYEIMMDDLRDYRFYKSDMIHPTTDAEDYIWNKFLDKYIEQYSRTFIEKFQAILAAMQHRPFHPASSAHQKFLKDLLIKIDDLKSYADLSDERERIASQIIK